MDRCKGYRGCALALLGGVGLLTAAAGPLRAEPLVQPGTTRVVGHEAAIDLGAAAAALGHYAQEVVGVLSDDLTTLSVTMIGGHVTVPTTPPTPPTTTGSSTPPPPPTDTGGTPTPPPPPPTTTGGPGPTPPPPTTQGGTGPSSAPEPATLITGLMGLGIASAAGWYQRRKRR